MNFAAECLSRQAWVPLRVLSVTWLLQPPLELALAPPCSPLLQAPCLSNQVCVPTVAACAYMVCDVPPAAFVALSSREVSAKAQMAKDVVNTVMHTLFYLCRVNHPRQIIAVEHDVIPILIKVAV